MGRVIISTSVCWVREHLPMAICVFNRQLTVTQRSMFVFHSKAVLVKSGSSTGVFQSLWNSLESLTCLSLVLRTLYSSNSNKSFRWPGVAQIPLCFMCFGLFRSSSASPVTLAGLGFVVCIQRRPVVVSIPSVCVSSCTVCPLCLSSLLLAQSLDRKWEIYFIWLELHCSFLATGVTSL